MNQQIDEARLARVLHAQRWAGLATVDGDGAPFSSWVAYVIDADQGCLWLHLSRLARHTRHVLVEPRVALAVSEADDGVCDPQTLARLTVSGRLLEVGREHADYAAAKSKYISHLPNAEPLFDFGDFSLFRFEISGGRYVEGFGRAVQLSEARLLDVVRRG